MTKKSHKKFLPRKRKFFPPKTSFRNLGSGEKNFRPPTNSAPGLRRCPHLNPHMNYCLDLSLHLSNYSEVHQLESQLNRPKTNCKLLCCWFAVVSAILSA